MPEDQKAGADAPTPQPEIFCIVCDAPGEFHCNACEEDVCKTHVAFMYHDCSCLSDEARAASAPEADRSA